MAGERVRVNGAPLPLAPDPRTASKSRRARLVALPTQKAAGTEIEVRPVSREKAKPEERPPAPSELNEVVRDAVEHASEIARDTASIGMIELKRTVLMLGPLIAWGTAAFLLGLVGVTLGLISLFLAAGAVVSSVAARLGVLAVILLACAGFAAFKARGGGKRGSTL